MKAFEPIFEAEVTHLSQQGYGVVRGPDRATYFVRGTWRGDRGRFLMTSEYEGPYRFAELQELLTPSPARRDSACPHLGLGDEQCFGCPWMTIDYAEQLAEKQHRVRYALDRVGLRASPLLPIWASPKIFQYRRRAQFKTDGNLLGYAGRQGKSIAPIDDCLILTPTLQQHLKALQKRLPEALWTPGAGYIWNYLDIDEDIQPEQLVLNQRRPFQQANAEQNTAMRQWLQQKLQDLPRNTPILELFAGSGNFTEVLVKLNFELVWALEAGANALTVMQSQQWHSVRSQRIDLYGPRALAEVTQLAHQAKVLIVNPPRQGLKHLTRLAHLLPELSQIILIACDPGSFAHDASRIVRQDFVLKEVQALDQMPHTPHVEILGWFCKPSPPPSAAH